MSDDFFKRVCPFKKSFNGRYSNVFIDISYKDGKLSLTGVEGPLSSGNCKGGAGQIDMSYFSPDNRRLKDERRYLTYPNELKFHKGWTVEMWYKLLKVWNEYHLNDMQPGCEHQRALRWGEDRIMTMKLSSPNLASGNVIPSINNIQKHMKGKVQSTAAPTCYVFGEKKKVVHYPVDLTPSWKFDSEYRHFIDTLYSTFFRGELDPADELAQWFAYSFGCRVEFNEQTSGWIRYTDHPKGVLKKPCPVCGYEYGTEWKKMEVPADVVEFLKSLPENTFKYAWRN